MGTRISDLTSATTLTGNEFIPVVQNGNTLKATVDQLKDSTVPNPATQTPSANSGVGSVGTSLKYAREDHVHPKSASLDPDVYLASLYMSRSAYDIPSRNNLYSTTTTPTSGTFYLSIFSPVVDLSVRNISFSQSAATAFPTLCKVGLYSWDESTGIATLIAASSNITISSGAGLVTAQFSDGVTRNLTAGSTYGIGFIAVGTYTTNQFVTIFAVTSLTTSSLTPSYAKTNTGMTDLPSSQSVWTSSNGGRPFFRLT
jgi:hypothetical protein